MDYQARRYPVVTFTIMGLCTATRRWEARLRAAGDVKLNEEKANMDSPNSYPVLLLSAMMTWVAVATPAEEGPLLSMERFANLNRIGQVVPRRSEAIGASRWGLQFNKHDLPLGSLNMFLERIAESGVKWARVETRGFPIKPTEGYYKWTELDQIVHGLVERKIEIFITINAEPFKNLASDKAPLQPADLNGWLGYVAAVVTRYHDRVQYWEILNEPGINANYATVVKAASKTIKGIDPKAKILAGSLVRVNVQGLSLMLNDFGLGPFIDGVTYHPYNEFPEASRHVFEVPVDGGYRPASALVAEMFALLKQADHPVALWQGECGFPSSDHTSGWKGRGPWGEYIQAKWLLRRFLTDFSLDVPVTVYFLLGEPPEEDRVNAKGLLRYKAWEPKPGYRALQNLTSLFDQRLNQSKQLEARFECLDQGSFYGVEGENADQKKTPFSDPKSPYPIEVVGLTGSGGDAVAYWVPWRMQEFVKPAKVNIRLKNVSIKNPVLADLLTGQVYMVGTKTEENGLWIKDIPLTDYPLAIIDKGLLKTQ